MNEFVDPFGKEEEAVAEREPLGPADDSSSPRSDPEPVRSRSTSAPAFKTDFKKGKDTKTSPAKVAPSRKRADGPSSRVSIAAGRGGGRCTAHAPWGTVCKLCGKVHPT